MGRNGKENLKKLFWVGIIVGGLLFLLLSWLLDKDEPAVVYAAASAQSEKMPDVTLSKEAFSSDTETALSSGSVTILSEGSISDVTSSAALLPVYICGAVQKPGIYHVYSNTYLYEAVELAGGLLPEAADTYINLVYAVTAPISVYIPTEEEAKQYVSGGQNNAVVPLLRDGLQGGIWGDASTISSEDSLEEVQPALVNINTANQAELETLPGIGAVTAADIIAYRESNGAFQLIEDLMQVTGIKQGRFDSLKGHITV